MAEIIDTMAPAKTGVLPYRPRTQAAPDPVFAFMGDQTGGVYGAPPPFEPGVNYTGGGVIPEALVPPMPYPSAPTGGYTPPPPGSGAAPAPAPSLPALPFQPGPMTGVGGMLPLGYDYAGLMVPQQQPNLSEILMPEEIYQYVPDMYRESFSRTLGNWLTGLGFQGAGNVGRYGERVFRPTGAWAGQPLYFDPNLFEQIADPTMRSWLRYIFGERGLTQRVLRPSSLNPNALPTPPAAPLPMANVMGYLG